MKLSELQRILKNYQDEYGDLDIKMHDAKLDAGYDFTRRNISATSENDDAPWKIEYITFWAS